MLLQSALPGRNIIKPQVAPTHATNLQTERLQPLVALAHNQFGAAAADIEYQSRVIAARQRGYHASVDQCCLFKTRHDIDMEAQFLGGGQKLSRIIRQSQRIGPDRPSMLDWIAGEHAPKALQAGDAARKRDRVDARRCRDTFPELHFLAETFDNVALSVATVYDQ